jgi:hypothetical protein
MISDTPLAVDLPCLDPADVAGIADFLVSNFITRSQVAVTTLLVDGRPIPLNSFVESFISKAVQGMTTSLKGCENAKEITISIRPAPTNVAR